MSGQTAQEITRACLTHMMTDRDEAVRNVFQALTKDVISCIYTKEVTGKCLNNDFNKVIIP